MGGSAGRGNVTPAAEYNIWADPEAAAAVFRAGWTVVVLGLDVTLRTGATPAVLQRMRELGPLGTELLLPALDQYRSVSEPSGPPPQAADRHRRCTTCARWPGWRSPACSGWSRRGCRWRRPGS